MQFSSGTYEAFAQPRIPEGAPDKHAWIIGAGLAGLSAAVFMIRDGGVPANHITIVERSKIPGGAMDGIKEPERGFVIRGGREMEDHFECLWDLFRSIPSLEEEGISVLDEFYRLNKDDPNYSLCRATQNQGQPIDTLGLFTLDKQAQKQIVKLFLATRESMEGKRIDEVFDEHFFESNFWMFWRTMFAFETWHSALEMKLYLHRFIHHIDGLADFSTLKFSKYNQYESFILPMTKWLIDQGVTFQYETDVLDIDFDITAQRKLATRIHWVKEGTPGGIDLTPNDLVLTTIGSLVDNSDNGDHATPAKLDRGPAPAWELWKKIARKDPSFGRPEVFCSSIDESKWQSATATTLDERIPEYIRKITRRDPFSGRVVTGGIVTVKDSSWLLSWTVNRQPHFKNQPKDQIVAWIYSLFVDTPGDYIKKPMSECTGEEITAEWLYHLGVPLAEINELAATGAKTVPVMMPYVTSFFMPRRAGDRPDIVPEGAVNFAFLGQFAETGRDTIFTTEYSVRTGMEAVYRLLGVERAVPETFASTYDVRTLLAATSALRDGEKMEIPGPAAFRKWAGDKLDSSVLGKLVRDAGVL
ncbi:oleate hydratase [Dermatophilus congolensis]|uniref:Oleate hydratase n=1 Tax=Dermatophilus congolensis TaxID=1863 RepID=A0A239V6A3_9MICO|nr:oleate hydratase [Dermatophilus congolensis]MBO3130333.1 oleate hydratase [Dermatophilus congolensis]MBO3131036.1 oleate hydratase [Dermatophilus congolensis]MBO3134804.1 oleate hydratase [Dermatophilus congolensis]MBO3137041.1 oleate hydratase [Dermatophilus congolensis]MBO3139285.1 oleate hydratase [Dermatophilus congolensis]